MPDPRLPLLARKAGALLAGRFPLFAYLAAAALATTGVWFIFWPAALITLAVFCLAPVVL